MWRRFVLVAMVLVALPLAAPAAVDKPLDDPTLEARALNLQQQIRCLVCQGQSIADSNSELAWDLRALVREHIAAGDSDQTVLDYLHDRYGDFVLLDPPMKPATYALWFGPPLLLVIGGVAVFLFHKRNRRRAAPAPTPLSDVERKALDSLLKEDGP